MARITIRLEDDLHDQLLYRAARAGMPCASMIRLMLRKLALPETTFRMLRTPGEGKRRRKAALLPAPE